MYDTPRQVFVLIISLLLSPCILAQDPAHQSAYRSSTPPFSDLSQQVFSNDNSFDSDQNFDLEMDEEQQRRYRKRESEAAANFEAIMVSQNRKFTGTINAPAKPIDIATSASVAGLLQAQSSQSNTGPAATLPTGTTIQPEVELPLKMFEALRSQVMNLQKKISRRKGPAVVLGAASYTGRAVPGALKLTLRLQVTLGRPGTYKTVPLVGDDAVLVNATVQGKPVAVSRKNGYHVWVTKQTGETEVKVELLIPQRGPRGSIEYDFLVDRTPVTKLSCFFPISGLEPRINASVQSVFTPRDKGTQVEATLRPTVRIHILGLKDLGTQQGREAKVYTESLNLLSVEENLLELFSVVRFTILYAGTKKFSLLLPKGMEIVSVDGVGAFRYREVKQDNGDTVLLGQTAFPIRNRYEISLRLRRKLTQTGSFFSVPLPKCLSVERQTGWLAVEVPGKLQLEEKTEITCLS